MLTRGRNRIANKTQLDSQISGHALAHAEVNALLQLDESKINPRVCKLYSLLEPCPMCTGAIRMMGIREFSFACRDPWAGSSMMVNVVPDLQRKQMKVGQPHSKAFETCIGAMLLVSYLEEGKDASQEFFQVWQQTMPEAADLAGCLYQEKRLQNHMHKNLSAKEVLTDLLSVLC